MRTTPVLVLVSFVLGLLFPDRAFAPVIANNAGNLTITGALPTELAGIAILASTGPEKGATIQIPPFVLPIVFAGAGRSDTTLLLTNASSTSLVLELTLRDGNGNPLTPSPVPVTLGALATRVILLSDLVP